MTKTPSPNECEGIGTIVELRGLGANKSALCPTCEYVDTFPLDVVERDGRWVGRVSPHDTPTPTLFGTLDELLKAEREQQ